jgi:hypothetical protein
VVLLEKMAEYGLPFWVAAIDFEKAFDTVGHDSLWHALTDTGVPVAYVRTLALLYSGQRGVVGDGIASKPFEIHRGTKQGDPLSPAIFNAVLEKALAKIIPVWNRRKYGIQLGVYQRRGRLCNLRFADDLLLIATSKRQLTTMLRELIEEVGKVGLVVHAGKSKVMTNGRVDCQGKAISVSGHTFEILEKSKATMYLGWALSSTSTQDAELHNRINKAWGKFMTLKSELCCNKYSLRSRLKLFDAVVTPTILYACGSWTMTSSRESLLLTTQRKMLRKILGLGRKRTSCAPQAADDTDGREVGSSDSDDSETDDDANEELEVVEEETWIEWIVRVTDIAENEARKAKITDWVQEQRKRKWRWAGHVMRRTDGRWSRKVLEWIPEAGRRRVGHPVKRWEDCIQAYLREAGFESWAEKAADRDAWEKMRHGFAARRR